MTAPLRFEEPVSRHALSSPSRTQDRLGIDLPLLEHADLIGSARRLDDPHPLEHRVSDFNRLAVSQQDRPLLASGVPVGHACVGDMAAAGTPIGQLDFHVGPNAVVDQLVRLLNGNTWAPLRSVSR